MPDHDALDCLALRSVGGDSEAFNALVEALAPDVSRFVAARASSAAMVDEVVQAAFVTTYLRIADYVPGGNLGGWIKGIARNHLYEELRRQRRGIADDDLAERLIAEDCLAAGEEAERRQDEAARLHACLER
nr:RNA polymerase sigma factor [bacterium]